MSDPKPSVLVRVDIDGRPLRLIVTRHLTGANQQGLHPVIVQARTLTCAGEILVDLTAGGPAEPAAATDQRPRPAAARSGGADRAALAGRDC